MSKWDYTERGKKYRKAYNEYDALRRKLDVISHYGGKCACCGEDRYEFLSIDHINGGGGRHREMIGPHILRWIQKQGYPEGYRILCHNCNQSLGFYGYCPHQKEAEK